MKGVVEPESKRKIIGKVFIDVFTREASKFNTQWLGQGTIYPDVVESLSLKDGGVNIKSHHNVGGLPDNLNLELSLKIFEIGWSIDNAKKEIEFFFKN